MEEDAVEVVAGLLGRDREAGAIDQLLELGRGQGEAVLETLVAHGRELVGRQAGQIERGAPAAQGDLAAARAALDAHARALGQLAHDIVQRVRRRSGRARLRDLGLGRLDHREIEIGRGQAKRAVPRLEPDVRQDRNGGPALDHALDVAKRLQECSSFDGKLHAPCQIWLVRGRSAGFAGRPKPRQGLAAGSRTLSPIV
jgi:hypothetical protein